jgi:hypothetical protein
MEDQDIVQGMVEQGGDVGVDVGDIDLRRSTLQVLGPEPGSPKTQPPVAKLMFYLRPGAVSLAQLLVKMQTRRPGGVILVALRLAPPNRLSRSASSSTFAKMFAGDTFALLKSRAATVRPSSFRPQGLRSSASCWMTSLSLPPPTRSGLSIVWGHAESSLFCAYRVDWWWDSGATVLLRWASRRCCLTANLCR